MAIYQLPQEPLFPHPNEAVDDGLLAIGGDLSPKRLITAYTSGIFPWYGDDDPILWWSPDPRLILFPNKFKVSKSLRNTIKKKIFDIRIDFAFEEVIDSCKKTSRKNQTGTWITDEMKSAYIKMHKIGLAHSVEAWINNKLVGGLYGLAIGNSFFGESMFHKYTDASKVAFYYLSQLALKWNYSFIDCQVSSPHLISLGAEEISRNDFLELLSESNSYETKQERWKDNPQKLIT